MNPVYAAILIGLASYRVWRLLAIDTVTAPVRRRIPGRAVRYFVGCPWCLGTWITGAVTLIADLTVHTGISAPWLVFGAASALTGLLGGYDPDQDMTDLEI